MNGAIAEPLVSTIRTPNKRRISNIGRSQYFFRCMKNSNMSLRKSIISLLLLKRFDNVCWFVDLVSFIHDRFLFFFILSQFKTILF
jgi:hypothetical protein